MSKCGVTGVPIGAVLLVLLGHSILTKFCHVGHADRAWLLDLDTRVARLGHSSRKLKMKYGIIVLKEGKGLERISRKE